MGCVYDNVTDTEISVKRRKVESHSAPLSYLPQHPNRSPSGATPPQPPQPLQLPPDVTPCLSTAEGSRHPSMSFGAESSGTLSVHPGAHDIPDPSIEANQATGMQDPPSEQGIPSDFRLHALEAEAVYLLRFLPSLEHSNLYALGVCADFILPPSILQQWIGIIVSELGERLSSGDPGVYQAICRKISSTTTRPLYIKEGSPVHQQIELMAGLETLRWEVVGILLAALGLAVVTSKSDSVLLQHVQDEYHGPDFLKRLLQACEHCQAFLGGNRDINQLFICLDLALVALYRGLRQGTSQCIIKLLATLANGTARERSLDIRRRSPEHHRKTATTGSFRGSSMPRPAASALHSRVTLHPRQVSCFAYLMFAYISVGILLHGPGSVDLNRVGQAMALSAIHALSVSRLDHEHVSTWSRSQRSL